MYLRRLILMLIISLCAVVIIAQDTETFTSEFAGNLILQHPGDWQAYDSFDDFVTVVARGDVSINNELDAGQSALLLMTPQALDFSGLPSNSADDAFRSLVGEIPADATITDFRSEYGFGTRYDFSLPGEMEFIVVTFDRDDVPLIAIIGMNDPQAGDVDDLLEVVKTVRYTDGAFDASNVLLSQLIIDPTYGYSYEIPASWQSLDNSSYTVRGTDDIATILLLTPDSIDDTEASVNFETVVQSELELVADSMSVQTEMVVRKGEDIDGFPTQEVVMILNESSYDGTIPAFEYRFVLVDYGDDQVLLSAIYSQSNESTERYLPALRAVAESFYYAPIYPLSENVEHAGLRIPYPEDFVADISNPNQIILTTNDITITINNSAQNVEIYGDVASESLSEFAEAVGQDLVNDDIPMQPVSIGTTEPAYIFSTESSAGFHTYLFVQVDSGDNILLVANHDQDTFDEARQNLEAIGSQLTVSASG